MNLFKAKVFIDNFGHTLFGFSPRRQNFLDVGKVFGVSNNVFVTQRETPSIIFSASFPHKCSDEIFFAKQFTTNCVKIVKLLVVDTYKYDSVLTKQASGEAQSG